MNARALRQRLPVPAALLRRWDRMSARERIVAATLAGALVLAVAWSLVWQPLQEDATRMRRDLARERAVLANARAQAAEMAGLQRDAPAQRGGDPRVSVERALGERGLQGALTSLDVKDGRTTLTFATIPFPALVGFLDALGKADGLRPIAATLVPRVEPGTLRAELTLRR